MADYYNHTQSFVIALWGKNTKVYWSRNPKRKAVVFIHGFGGDADTTFNEFNLLFRNYDAFKDYDIFFYGYESLKQRAEVSALDFSKFLDYLNDGSNILFKYSNKFKSTERQDDFTYERILIVSHSLGALVTRLALMEAYKNRKPWPAITQMVMYAPAHMGTDLIKLALNLFSGPWKILAFAVLYKIPILRDLKEGSDTLKKLVRESNSLQRKNRGDFTISKRVLWAQNENVVNPTTFPGDPEAIIIPQTSHFTVCKPLERFLQPIDELIPCL